MSAPTKQCLRRLQRELRDIKKEEDALKAAAAASATTGGVTGASPSSASARPASSTTDAAAPTKMGTSSFVTARPDPRNLLLWYFLVEGPEATPYAGGRYLGTLRFPSDYPFKPPTIMVLTPNGRFETETAICMSNSSFHPEQWSPIWSIQTIVLGFVSFMVSDDHGAGGISRSVEERQWLAKESIKFNLKNFKYIYEQALPEQYAKDVQRVKEEAEAAAPTKHTPEEHVENDTKNGKKETLDEQKNSTSGNTDDNEADGGANSDRPHHSVTDRSEEAEENASVKKQKTESEGTKKADTKKWESEQMQTRTSKTLLATAVATIAIAGLVWLLLS